MSSWPDPQPTADVNPSEASIAALREQPDNNAFIMLNLLKYAPGDGAEAYARYAAAAGPVVRSQGGNPVYMGAVGNSPAWDVALFVRYPRRAAYLAMQTDPAYVGAIPDRTEGLSARLLYPFHDPAGPADDPFAIEVGEGEALAVCLSNESTAVNDAQQVVDLVGDVPMVSDDKWNHFSVWRFPSAEAAQSANPGGDTMWLVTQPIALP